MKINKILAAGVAATLAVTSLTAVAGAEIGTSATTREFSLVHSRGKVTYSAYIAEGAAVDVKPIETYFGFKKEQVTEGVEKPSWDYAVENVWDIQYGLYDAFIPFCVTGLTDDFVAKGGKVKIQIVGTKYDNGNTKTVGDTTVYELQYAGDVITTLNGYALKQTAVAPEKQALYILPIYSGISGYTAFNPGEYNSIDRIKIDVEGMESITYNTYNKNEYENLIETDAKKGQTLLYNYDVTSTWNTATNKLVTTGTGIGYVPTGTVTQTGYCRVMLMDDYLASVYPATFVRNPNVYYTVDRAAAGTVVTGAGASAKYASVVGKWGEVPKAAVGTDIISDTDAEIINAAIDAVIAAGNNPTTVQGAAVTAAATAVTVADKVRGNVSNYNAADAAIKKVGDYVVAAKNDPAKDAIAVDAYFIKANRSYNEALAGVEISKTGSGRTGLYNKAPEFFEKFRGLFGNGYKVQWHATAKELESRYAYMPMTDGLNGQLVDRTLVRDEIIELSTTQDYNSWSTTNGYTYTLRTWDWANQSYEYNKTFDYNQGTLPEGFAGMASQFADFFNHRLNGKVTFHFVKLATPEVTNSWIQGGIPSTEVGVKGLLTNATYKDIALFVNYGTTTGSLMAQTEIKAEDESVTFDVTDILKALSGNTIGTVHDVYYGLTNGIAQWAWNGYGNGRPGLLVDKVTFTYDETLDVAPATDTAAATDNASAAAPVEDTTDDEEDTAAIADDDDDDDDDDAAIIADDDDDDDDDDTAAVITDDDEDDSAAAGAVDVVTPAGNDTNPATGVGLAVVPAIVAAAAMAISKKRK